MGDKKPLAEQYYAPPPDLGKWEAFSEFLWNPDTKQFLGRTGTSWAKILLFYLIFYAVLVGFFATILAVFFQTLDAQRPKWLLDSSLIGNNPGLGFRPMPQDSNVDSTLIYYRANDKGSVQKWARIIDHFLAPYRDKTKPGSENRVPCGARGPPPQLADTQVCDVQLADFAPCTADTQYNYERRQPCVFLKLNKIYGWTPQPYNSSQELPRGMPTELQQHVADVAAGKVAGHANTVWVSCEGENPADVENIGPIHYIPERGFPAHYFPYTNRAGYLSPLVAVRFENPRTGVLINIECKAWAKNIMYDRYERRGSVHFELMVDHN